MTLNLKTVIFCSTLLAAGLNAVHYLSSAPTRKDAFSPAWAYASPTPSAAPAKVASVTPAAAPAPAASDATAAAAAKLSAAGLSPAYAATYLSVQQQTGTPWQLLAAVHKIETNQSGDTARTSYAGATGPMQFMPATWNHYAIDGNGDGTRDITDLDDAMITAGRYLAAGGANRGQYATALYNYNHSWGYVSNVMTIAHRLGL